MPRPVLAFVGLTFLSSWTLALGYFAAGGRTASATYPLMAVAYMLAPATAAWIVQGPRAGGRLASLGLRWRFNRWVIAAWLLPLAFSLASLLGSLLLPGVELSSGVPFVVEKLRDVLPARETALVEREIRRLGPAFPLLLVTSVVAGSLLAGPTVNAIVALGEELGWRGFLLHQLLPLGFWRASLGIGIVWGLWHAPLVLHGHNYPRHPVGGVGMMTALTVLLSPLLCYVRLRAGTVIAPAVAHGALNASAGASVLFLRGGGELTTGATGAVGLALLLVANGALFLHLRRSPLPAPGEEPPPARRE